MAHPVAVELLVLDSGAKVLSVTVDPSAGGGIVAPVGSIAVRDNGGAGELWQKYGAADTAWQKIETAATATQAFETMNEPTGFENRTDSIISKNDGSLTFTISPAVTDYVAYTRGTRHTIDLPDGAIWTDVEGLHYFYVDGAGALQHTVTFVPEIITEYAFVAVLYWDVTNSQSIYFADERHGLSMDGQTHLYLHTVFGSQYVSGLGLSGITIGDGSLNTHAQLAVADGFIRDEDLIHAINDTIQDLAPTAQIPIFYQLGPTGTWRKKTADSYPLIYSGTAGYTGANGRIPYNQDSGGTWSLTEIGEDEFALVHLFATNDITQPVIGIQGQTVYSTLAGALDGARVEIDQLLLAGLPVAEFTAIATVMWQSNSTYVNAPKARIRQTDAGEDYVDWRGFALSPGSGVALGAHDLGGSLHNADTIANLQSKVSDATLEIQANKDQADGYAGLDGSTKLAGAQQTYGAAANTACEGNDARLSNARTPTAHDFAGGLHSADTWTNFVAKVTGQTPAAVDLAQAFTATQRASPQALSVVAGEIDVDAAARNVFYVELTDATQELKNPTSPGDAMVLWFYVKSGSTGRVLTYDTEYDWGDAGSDDLSSLPSDAWAIIMASRIPTTSIWALSMIGGFGP